ISSLTPGVSVDYSANVSAVPVPAGVWLFGSGLFFLFGFVKRRA
ncbi:MAG TPA: PEP-CTERM sorting domain-containing protein, partial [Thiotrichales bacterium]|nr:PEP-CTERM sorting domain-containing protein [Thiotrichales bacterium]